MIMSIVLAIGGLSRIIAYPLVGATPPEADFQPAGRPGNGSTSGGLKILKVRLLLGGRHILGGLKILVGARRAVPLLDSF